MRRRRAVAVGVAVVMLVAAGMNVSHGHMLYYNITGVHALAPSQIRLLAALIARGLLRFTLFKERGRREDRVRAAPAVSRANAHQETHTSIQVQRKHSGLPCAMALRLTSRSPR